MALKMGGGAMCYRIIFVTFFSLFAVSALADLRVSTLPDRSANIALDGAVDLGGDIYVFVDTSAIANVVKSIEFFLDTSSQNKDNGEPYDLVGGNAAGADPMDTLTLLNGSHTLDAIIEFKDKSTQTLTAVFSITNSGPANLGSELRISSVEIDFNTIPNLATISGNNFSRNFSPLVALGDTLLNIASNDDNTIIAELPVGLVEDLILNVSTDGSISGGFG